VRHAQGGEQALHFGGMVTFNGVAYHLANVRLLISLETLPRLCCPGCALKERPG
jgi:hypothetical protein